MKSKQFTKRRFGGFVTLAAVTAGLVVVFTGTATAGTPAPDLVQRWLATHQTQAPDLIERKVAVMKSTAPDLIERKVAVIKSSQVLAPDDVIRNIGAQTTPVGTTAAGLKADGLRYQAIANAYERIGSTASVYTPQQLQAMALRYQAMTQFYAKKQSGPTPQGLKADGLRYQAMADAYLRSGDASSHYTSQQLHAMALRYQAMAKQYEQSSGTTTSSTGTGFDWGDSGIGAAVGLGIALCGIGLIAVSRRSRGQQLAV